MPASTVQDMLYMLPELSSLDSGAVSFWLNEGQRQVIIDGFQIVDENFDMLHRYMTAHLLFTNNIIKGTISQESVSGSISVSYAIQADGNYNNFWLREYILLKTRLTSGAGRIA